MKKTIVLNTLVCLFVLSYGVLAQSQAKVAFIKGDVNIIANGKTKKIAKDAYLPICTKIKTGKDSGVTFSIDGKSVRILGEEELTIQDALNKKTKKNRSFSKRLKRRYKLTAITTPDLRAGDSDTFNRGDEKYWKLLEEEKYKQIIQQLKQPKEIGENYVLGIACFMEKDYEKAIKNLKRVSRFSLSKESKENVNTKLAYSYTFLGKYKKAIRTLKKVRSPKSPLVYQMLIANYEYIFDDKNAQKYREKLKKEFPKSE